MLRSKLKKIVAVLILSSMVFTVGTLPAIADTYQESYITPRLSYIVDSECIFNITGTTATVNCSVTGDVLEATKAKVIAELQVESGTDNWIPVAIWTDTQNGHRASVYETKNVTKGNNYRVKVTCFVWEGSASEDLIFFSDEVTA